MQCFVKSLIGLESTDRNVNDRCVVLPPIVRSLVASALFIILMSILMHLIKV